MTDELARLGQTQMTETAESRSDPQPSCHARPTTAWAMIIPAPPIPIRWETIPAASAHSWASSFSPVPMPDPREPPAPPDCEVAAISARTRRPQQWEDVAAHKVCVEILGHR